MNNPRSPDSSNELFMRKAVETDSDLLLEWRNDPITRQASINHQVVSLEEHQKWFYQASNNPKIKLFIIEQHNDPIGTVRAVQKENGWELSWTVSPNYRGKGLAKRMVASILNELSGNLMAKVKKENIASQKVALFLGMKLIKQKNGVYHYFKKTL